MGSIVLSLTSIEGYNHDMALVDILDTESLLLLQIVVITRIYVSRKLNSDIADLQANTNWWQYWWWRKSYKFFNSKSFQHSSNEQWHIGSARSKSTQERQQVDSDSKGRCWFGRTILVLDSSSRWAGQTFIKALIQHEKFALVWRPTKLCTVTRKLCTDF